MSFNLPPKKSSPLDDILPGIVTAIGLGVFFASPLGGIFFAITNSLFVLALLTPVVLIVGFQLWKTFNAVDATCPSCGSPVTALKNGEPTMCFGCGSVLRTNREGNGVELCNAGPSFEEEVPGFFGADTSEIFEDFFGGQRGVVAESVKTEKRQEERVKKVKRESTVIDIDVIQD